MRNLVFVATLFIPLVASAQSPRTFKDVVDIVLDINQSLVLLIFALTFIVLIWAIIKTWVIGGGDADSVERGKKIVTVGIIVLVVMSGIWGILQLLRVGIFGF